nr:hypothetical protein [Tanacetum cinerariifolium]
MSTPTVAKTPNLIAFLEKPIESDGFKQIVDFLNANPIKYALTVSLTIYTSCIKQFWTSTKVKTVNEDVRLQALIDRMKVIINEASIRCDLRLNDVEGTACLPNAAIFEELARMRLDNVEGTACLPNAAIFEELARMRVETGFSGVITPLFETMMVQAPEEGKYKSMRKQMKETEVSQDEPPTEEHIPTPSHDPLPSGEDRLQLNELMEICTKLSGRDLSLEQIKTNQAAEIKKLKKRVKKLEGKKKRTQGLKRLYKVGLSARVESSEEEEGLGDQEEASKQGRVAEIDADADLSLINEIAQDQERMNDEDLFGVRDLYGDEVIVDVTAGENVKHDATAAEKEVSIAADEVVTTTKSVEGIIAATTPQISKDDVTLAQTLIEIKEAKPRARGAKEKGKGIMVEPEKPLKKKDQIALDEEVARKLDAQMKAKIEDEER